MSLVFSHIALHSVCPVKHLNSLVFTVDVKCVRLELVGERVSEGELFSSSFQNSTAQNFQRALRKKLVL